MKEITRQAVIVVHGMGEQRPMDTLRSFVKGVKWQMEQSDHRETRSKVRSKPDSVGDIYETVRLSMESNYETGRPITDFYEFYWAHNMRGTTFGQMRTWLGQLMFRDVRKIPKHLQRIWWTVTSIAVLCLLVAAVFSLLLPLPIWVKGVTTLFGGGLLSMVAGFITSFFKSSFLNSLGDVARYMTPEPDNIGERSAIRQQGITFLKKIHEITNRTKPDRIIVVAHSLGCDLARPYHQFYRPFQFCKSRLVQPVIYYEVPFAPYLFAQLSIGALDGFLGFIMDLPKYFH